MISLLAAALTLMTDRILSQYERQRQNYHYIEEMIKESRIRSDEQRELYDSIRQLRHDARAYISDVKKMLENKELDRMPAFLSEIEAKLPATYSTGNSVLDSVLDVKLKKMQRLKISFRGSNLHYTGGINIEDFVLASLVSNMLDNAIEALTERQSSDGEMYISLKFTYARAGLIILCENPLLGIQPKRQKASFLSSKVEPYHGLGISIMEKIVSDTGGSLNISIEGDSFRVLAQIPPKKEDAPG